MSLLNTIRYDCKVLPGFSANTVCCVLSLVALEGSSSAPQAAATTSFSCLLLDSPALAWLVLTFANVHSPRLLLLLAFA
jgi:hypothetical protein